MIHIYNGILLSPKGEQNNSFYSNMFGLKDELSEVKQTEKDKYHMISLMWTLIFKNDTNELIYKTETDLQILKTNVWLPKGKGGQKG